VYTLDPPPEGAHDVQYLGEDDSNEKLAEFEVGMARATEMDKAFDQEFESEFGPSNKT
jgi:hypothetical protein